MAYDIAGHGTVRVLGIADTGPRQERYDDAYVEDHDNQYDIILAGDRSAVEQLVRVHMPAEEPYSAVYNPGGPGNAPESNPDVPFTVPSSPQSIGISNLIGQDPYMTYVEVDGADHPALFDAVHYLRQNRMCATLSTPTMARPGSTIYDTGRPKA